MFFKRKLLMLEIDFFRFPNIFARESYKLIVTIIQLYALLLSQFILYFPFRNCMLCVIWQ